MNRLIFILPFILMLVPTVAVDSHALEQKICRYADEYACTHYFMFESQGQLRTSNYGVSKMMVYEEDAYGRSIMFPYSMPAWTDNLRIWYFEGKVGYSTVQTMYDYMVNNNIAKPMW